MTIALAAFTLRLANISNMSDSRSSDPRPISEARLLSMVNASGDSFWETDVDRRFVHVNDNMCRMMGYSREQLRGRSVFEFMTPEYKSEVAKHPEKRAADGNPLANAAPLRHEGGFFRQDGSKLWIETVSVPVFGEDGMHLGYFGITRDETERKQVEQDLLEANRQLEQQLLRIHALHEEMREQAIRDHLTGVHNRRHFVNVIELEFERARLHGTSLSLVMLDIDHFKSVNDAHGHPTGDAALKAVGTLLNTFARTGDLACRLGGEEFAVLLVGTGHAAATERAERWRSAIAELPIPVEASTLRLSASFGVATCPDQAGTPAELMKIADTHMYKAKSLGRNRVVGGTGVA
ncbi:MAG TPA: diguanylate cyclase [Burkholderiaceae bacterium]